MTDYIYKHGNFNSSTIKTVFSAEGYYDDWNTKGSDLAETVLKARQIPQLQTGDKVTGKYRVYEFVIIPSTGFLADSQPLPHDTEIKLKFDRAPTAVSMLGLAIDADSISEIEIKNCYAQAEYISSPVLRNHFLSIENEPLTYTYDTCEVMLKNIDVNSTNLRFDHMRGGNLPKCLFAAIIPTEMVNGSLNGSSTGFNCHGVKKFNLTLDGSSVNGFPIQISNQSLVYPLFKFNDTVNKLYNVTTADSFTGAEFTYNFIWSHNFESESTSSGWLGIEIELENNLSTPHTLVVWCIAPSSLTIDKFHQIERFKLKTNWLEKIYLFLLAGITLCETSFCPFCRSFNFLF